IELVAEEPPEPNMKQILVQIAGEVHHPGVYRLAGKSRVMDAIAAAGGLTENADTESLNLVARVTDGQKLTIESKPPEVAPSETIVPDGSTERPGTWPASAQSLPPASAASRSSEASRHVAGKKININTAQPHELATLPGIGEKLAQRIVYHRHQNGPFRRIEDLTEVEGIGEETLMKLRPYLTR
ncbi:MAG: helix-hairpin-helix domain-containing protein, partial [Armatimonadota bacterium]